MSRKKKAEERPRLLRSDIDFIYNGVECEYETNYNCEVEKCNEEGICRCSTINDGRVTQIYPKQIINAYTNSKLEEDRYYVDRILSLSGGYYTSNYEVYGQRDCYGEQACVRFHGETELHTKYQEVSKLSFTDAVKKLLIWEYGFLLDEYDYDVGDLILVVFLDNQELAYIQADSLKYATVINPLELA